MAASCKRASPPRSSRRVSVEDTLCNGAELVSVMAEPKTERSLLARAAVRGPFDPLAVANRKARSFDAETAYLAERSTEQKVGERWLWVLTSAARLEGLKELPSEAALRTKFLGANPPDPGDSFGQMLHRALAQRTDRALTRFIRAITGESKPGFDAFASLSIDEQVMLFQVVEALLGAGIPLPGWITEDTARKVQRSIAARHKDESAKVLLPDKFRGRVRQRKLLIDFVGRGLQAVAAFKAKPKFAGLALNESDPAFTNPIPALAVTGVGGIGKSALLATTEQVLKKKQDITLISFDFDRPDLRAGDSAALTMDLSRQLALLEPSLDAPFSESRRALRQAPSFVTSAGTYELANSAAIGAFSAWATILAGHQRISHPLVFLMDTFEEVLVGSEARLFTLAEWAIKLRDIVGFREIRIVFFGRGIETIQELPPTYIYRAASIELGDLGLRSGEAKLPGYVRAARNTAHWSCSSACADIRVEPAPSSGDYSAATASTKATTKYWS